MVAHFYATVSYLFCSQPGTMQFCCKIQHVFNILQDMKKADIEKKKSLGRALYLSGMEQTEIADKIGVSRVTVSNGAQLRAGKKQERQKASPDRNWSTNYC